MLETLTYKEVVCAYNVAVLLEEYPENIADPTVQFSNLGGDPDRWPILAPLVSMWLNQDIDIVRADYEFIVGAMDQALDYINYDEWLEDYEGRPSTQAVLENTGKLFYGLKAHDALHQSLLAQADLLSALLGLDNPLPQTTEDYHCIAFPGKPDNHPIADAMIATYQAFAEIYDFPPLLYPVDLFAASHQEQGPILSYAADTYCVATTLGTVYLTRVPSGQSIGGLPPLRPVDKSRLH